MKRYARINTTFTSAAVLPIKSQLTALPKE
jgi:hypothetical protein